MNNPSNTVLNTLASTHGDAEADSSADSFSDTPPASVDTPFQMSPEHPVDVDPTHEPKPFIFSWEQSEIAVFIRPK